MKKFKFKLIDDGFGGLEVSFKEVLSSGNWSVIDDVSRKRKIPVSDELVAKVQLVKYYFLNLTGHWIVPYDKLFDRDKLEVKPIQGPTPTGGEETLRKIWQNTTISGAGGDETEFYITGKIETVDGKFIGLTTPKITVSDDVPFFNECYDLLIEIMNGISEYMQQFQLTADNARKMLKPEDVEGLSEDELVNKYAEFLEEKGWIMLEAPRNAVTEKASEPEPDTEDNGEKQPPEEETQEDRNERIAEAQEEGVDPDQSPPWKEGDPPQKKEGEAFGPPAATIGADLEDEVPKPADDAPKDEVADLNAMEHTENIGEEEDEEW